MTPVDITKLQETIRGIKASVRHIMSIEERHNAQNLISELERQLGL